MLRVFTTMLSGSYFSVANSHPRFSVVLCELLLLHQIVMSSQIGGATDF